MKCAGYLVLCCGLLSSSMWGESAPKHPLLVVRTCVALSCNSSTVRKGESTIVVGTFKPLRVRVLNASAHRAPRQAPAESLLAKINTNSFAPVVWAGITTHAAQEGRSPAQSDVLQAQGTQPTR